MGREGKRGPRGGGREGEGGEGDFGRGPRGEREDFGPGRRVIFRFFFLINFDNCFCCLIIISGALKIQVKFEGSF